MPYDVSDFVDAPVITKNRMEQIRVFKHQFMGTTLISVRLFSPRGIPLDKGICLQPEHWRLVLPHLEKLLALDDEGGDTS